MHSASSCRQHPHIYHVQKASCVPAQCQEHREDTRRQVNIPGEVEGAIEGQQNSSRSVNGSTVRALQNELQTGTPVHVSAQTVIYRLHGGEERRDIPNKFQRTPELEDFSQDSLFFSQMFTGSLSIWVGRMRVRSCCGECFPSCNIFQHYRFGDESVIIWGGTSLEQCTDLCILATGNCLDEIQHLPIFCSGLGVLPSIRNCPA